jgi:hypothetical protein
VEVGIPSTRG